MLVGLYAFKGYGPICRNNVSLFLCSKSRTCIADFLNYFADELLATCEVQTKLLKIMSMVNVREYFLLRLLFPLYFGVTWVLSL